MGIKPKFTQNQIHIELARRVKVIEVQVIRYLQRLGELCLTEARTNKTYQDQTGNLTASMGYIVVANGIVITQGGFNAKYGGTVGRALALNKATGHSTGYALIVVAGMGYAYEVETRGYNVLASAELVAERELPRMLAQLNRNIGKITA